MVVVLKVFEFIYEKIELRSVMPNGDGDVAGPDSPLRFHLAYLRFYCRRPEVTSPGIICAYAADDRRSPVPNGAVRCRTLAKNPENH